MWYEVIMKKFGDNRSQASEHEYAGLTLKELENQLVTEGPEGRIKNIVRVIICWGRPLLALSLAAVLIWGAVYIISLKKEINELREQISSQSASLTQAENNGPNKLAEESPPVSEPGTQSGDILQEKNAGQDKTVEETEPESSEEPPQEETGEPGSEPGTQSVEITPPISQGDPSQNNLISHSVRSGDNLSTISGLYYSREDFAPFLATLNGITEDSQLNVGQEIMVPEKPYESWTSADR
jgi:hypothetical protein